MTRNNIHKMQCMDTNKQKMIGRCFQWNDDCSTPLRPRTRQVTNTNRIEKYN